MRRYFLVVVVFCAAMMLSTTGCTEKNKVEPTDSDKIDTLVVDTFDTVKTDSVVEATPMPKAADKLFADFFFDFVSKKKVQMNRILFPLKVTNGTSVNYVQRNSWRMERFYQNQDYYTQIFDNEKQLKMSQQSDLDSVIVEKIYLQKGIVEQFLFNRPEGKWMLTELRTVGLSQSKNATFLTFLRKFFADKGFQMNNILNPLPYYGPDPDSEDEDRYVNTRIPSMSWSDYVPEIPGDLIYNILYGQEYEEGNSKIFLFKGMSNGLETELRFKRQGGKWRLVKVSL